MSKIREKLAAEQDELQEQPVAEEIVEQTEPVAEPVEEIVEEPVVEEVQEESTEGVADKFGDDYKNQWGKVTPYHILFKDFGDQISTLNGPQSIEFVTNKITELNSEYGNDKDYTNPSPSALTKFEKALDEKAKTGMDVLFTVKDFLLATEGLSVESTLEAAFESPKMAKRVAKVFNHLIYLNENVKSLTKISSDKKTSYLNDVKDKEDSQEELESLVYFLEKEDKDLLNKFLDNTTVDELLEEKTAAVSPDLQNSVDKLVNELINSKASQAAQEIGFSYDEGVDTLIKAKVDSILKIEDSTSISQIDKAIEDAIEEWKKDTKQNQM